MAGDKSVPVILGLGGLAVVFLTSGITGNSIGEIFKGQFGSVPTSSGIPPASPSSSGMPTASTSSVNVGALVQAPSDAPGPIVSMVSWCNSVAGQYQYTWGGGHDRIGIPNAGACSSSGAGHCFGFDCSGAVSGALGAAGMLSAPLVSGDLASWGDPGPGKYVTVYANSIHTFMRILGHWFGTGKLGRGGGVDWGNFDPDLVAYSVRHPKNY